ncbi:MAG: hypothetical protein JWO09_515 [Bacteroidetes bacterium]|nr:hypothetical protein [Bacteroidota bacterium]
MIYRYFFFALLFLSFNNLRSQSDTLPHPGKVTFDSIRFVNGSRQAAKIIEISDKYVKYKNPLNLDGPVFSVRKKDVAGFILKDGCMDLKQQGFENCVKDPTYGIIEEKKFKRAIISIDLLQLMGKHLQINADYIFKNRKNGIGVSGNLGFLDPYDRYTFDVLETRMLFSGGSYKKKYIGFDFKIFPSPHKTITYYCSFGIDFGQAYLQKVIITPSGWQATSGGYFYLNRTEKTVTDETTYIGYRFNNGFIWRITPHIICQGLITIGANQFSYYVAGEEKRVNTIHPKITGGLTIGYAF